MKKILLLFYQQSQIDGRTDPENLVRLLNEAGDADYSFWYLDDLRFEVGEVTRISHSQTDEDLADFDAVYFRYWGKMQSEAHSAAMYLEKRGVPYVDRETLGLGSVSKMTQYYRLWADDLPIPQTMFVAPGGKLDFDELESHFGVPFVMKSAGGTRGEDNFLINDVDDFNEIESHSDVRWVIQEYIPNTHDYRVFVLGDKAQLIIRRTSSDGGYKHNVSQGAKADLIEASELGDEIIAACIKAAKAFGREIAGVDIILDEQMSPVFLEVNRSPQMDGGASFSGEKAKAVAEYLEAIQRGND